MAPHSQEFTAPGAPGYVAGWMAAVMLLANYPLFKLGYLARPDMLVVFWLLAAWWSATRLLIDDDDNDDDDDDDVRRSDHRRRPCERILRIIYWLSVAAAGLTKGPVAMLPLMFAIIGGRIIAGSWRTGFARFGWWWGLPLVLIINGAWIIAVWRVDPSHLRGTLWAEEFLGRITGTGSEGARQGPIELLTGILDMPAYFMIRFAPWSVLAVLVMIAAARAWRRSTSKARGTALQWRMSATVFVLLVVAVMSLSAGKRADYIAPAYPMAALLAGWWLVELMMRLKGHRRGVAPALVALAVAVSLGALTLVNLAEPGSPHPQFSRGIEQFIQQAAHAIEQRPAPVRFCWTGETHVQAMLGESHEPGRDAVFSEMRHGEPFWVVAGLKTSEPHEFSEWMAMRGEPARLTPVVRSIELPRDRGWPVQMTLYWLEPTGGD